MKHNNLVNQVASVVAVHDNAIRYWNVILLRLLIVLMTGKHMLVSNEVRCIPQKGMINAIRFSEQICIGRIEVERCIHDQLVLVVVANVVIHVHAVFPYLILSWPE